MITYNDYMIVRDIVYFYHECAEYRSVAFDLRYGTALAGPYHNYLDSEDDFLRVGCTLIFLGMLLDWNEDSGFAFGTYRGETRQPLAFYLIRFLYLYEQARTTPDSPILDIYHAVMDVLAQIARRESDATTLEQVLDTPLLKQLHQAIQTYEATMPAPTSDPHQRLYEKYIRPYFVERAR